MAVSEKAWDGSVGRFTDEQYQASCVLDRKACGGDWASKPPKVRCSLPIKEPDGSLNRAGVHAAASRISSVSDVCDSAMASAKSKLRAAYKTLGEDVPASIGGSDKAKSDDMDEWGVREGEPRHGQVALRAADDGEWLVRDDAETADGCLGVLTGHFSVFNRWTTIDNFFEGTFMERIAPGAFTKTFQENRKNMRVLLNHGRDPSVGMKPLGPIRDLEQDDIGARYDVDLLDTTYNRDIMPGLRSSQYGASFRFQVIQEKVNTKPERSAHNPMGIEERTITEAKVREFGPVTFGAYEEATAGLRSLNVEFFDLDIGLRSLDPTAAAQFINHLRAGGNGGAAESNGRGTRPAPSGAPEPARTTRPRSTPDRRAARTLPAHPRPSWEKEPKWKI